MDIVSALIALCGLIFVHELGHFCAARICGVGVEVFSIGFGKKLWTKRIGHTEYALSLIPLGGYVKLQGIDSTSHIDASTASHHIDSPSSSSFLTQPIWKKLIILIAGIMFNLLLALCIYLAIGLMGVKILLPIVGNVAEHSPAQRAGILPGDVIIALDEKSITSWEDIIHTISSKQQEHGAFNPISITILRESHPAQSPSTSIKAQAPTRQTNSQQTITLHITPESTRYTNIFGEEMHRPMIGIIAKGELGEQSLSMMKSLHFAQAEVMRASALILTYLQKLLLGIVPLDSVGGVIGIVDVLADVAPSGLYNFFMLVALISINLAIINLLPIPALDGGQILLVCYEAWRKKPMSNALFTWISLIGWGIIIMLLMLGAYNDISRISARFTP